MTYTPTIGIVRFPGANCEQDCLEPLLYEFGVRAVYVWHQTGTLEGLDAVILPGGFSYGDYLRSGALARFSPVVRAVKEFASKGRPVLGICNGFQVLTESGLLPGALVRNRQGRFLCEVVAMTCQQTQTPFTQGYVVNQLLHLPIAHAEGQYVAEKPVLEALETNHQVVFRYAKDVNGSREGIAGICNTQGNVLGMMPHPERAIRKNAASSGDGRRLFESLIAFLTNGASDDGLPKAS